MFFELVHKRKIDTVLLEAMIGHEVEGVVNISLTFIFLVVSVIDFG